METDRYERLDFAERWYRDGLRVVDTAGFFLARDVDMTNARALEGRAQAAGRKVTCLHIVVRALAIALTRHPDMHQLVGNSHRLLPRRIDLSVSVAGETMLAPVLILEDAGRKTLPELADEFARRLPEVRAREAHELAVLRRWGWLVPFGWLRRGLLGLLRRHLSFRRRGAGTFQVSRLPDADMFVPMLFSTSAILGMGRVRDRVIAVNGQPAVRPVATLTLAADHKVFDGMRVMRLLSAVAQILEGEELAAELIDSAAVAPCAGGAG
jgi:pyruvate dehydrogenase E2 component (dihydrolipoamide acetyltransferase)